MIHFRIYIFVLRTDRISSVRIRVNLLEYLSVKIPTVFAFLVEEIYYFTLNSSRKIIVTVT